MQDLGFLTDFTVYNIFLIQSLSGQSCKVNIISKEQNSFFHFPLIEFHPLGPRLS